MAKRKTPNEIEWVNKTNELKRRIAKLNRQGEDTSDISLPTKPKAYTKKSLTQLVEVEKELIKRQQDHNDRHIQAKRKTYDDKEKAYNQKVEQHRIKMREGNPKGNPQNLQHKGNTQNLQHKGRPKGSKNKATYTRTQKTRPISSNPPTANNTTSALDIMYNRLMKAIAKGDNYHSVSLTDFFKALESTLGKYGMLDIVSKAEENGVYLTDDIIFSSNDETVNRYMSFVTSLLDDEEFEVFREYTKKIEEEWEEVDVATPFDDDIEI